MKPRRVGEVHVIEFGLIDLHEHTVAGAGVGNGLELVLRDSGDLHTGLMSVLMEF